MSKFKFSQTALKDLENPETCPLRWKGLWLDQAWKRTPSLAMLKGSYFEQLFLGKGAGDEIVSDLPRLRNGNKSKDQIRIEEQAQRARDLFDPNHVSWLGFYIEAVQLHMEGTDRKGTIDIVATDSHEDTWLIDVKLTGDLTSTYGDYGWGRDYNDLDLIQLPHYQELYYRAWGFRPRIALFICDYSTSKRVEFNEIVITEDKLRTLDKRFTRAQQIYSEYSETEFPVFPSIKECKNCKLECKHRINGT